MSPNAENLAFEKEIEYIHGFLDAIQLIRADANPILMRVPEAKRVDALMEMIDCLNSSAIEKQSENTRIFFFNHWNLERWMQQEGVTPEKYQSEEKHEAEKQEESTSESITVNVTVPKAFLQNVVGYMKKTGSHYNDLDEFVLEALREKMLKVL